jgi:hypothetical protein
MASGDLAPAKTFAESLQTLKGMTRKRSASVSSSSSLSSAKSLDADTFVPTINEEASVNGPRATAKSRADQRLVASHRPGANKSRGPTKIGLFSVFPNANKHHARKSAEPELDQLELSRRRQRLQQNQSFHEDYNSKFHAGESSERAVTAPGTSRPGSAYPTSSTAPVVHPHKVTGFHTSRASPVATLARSEFDSRNGISKKRSRDETDLDDEDLPTPRSSPGLLTVHPQLPASATISRSGTPRASRMPPSKKIRKSARVMVS